MNRRASTLGILTLGICVMAFIVLMLKPDKASGLAQVSMLNIGQGDSFLIQAPNGKQLLIDGGRDATVLTELVRVMPRGDKSIDVVIATHPDADHIGGLPLVLSRYRIGMFLTSEVMTDTQIFRDLFAKLEEKQIPSYYVRHGMTLMLDSTQTLPTTFSVLFPDRETSQWETNTASVVGRLQIGERAGGRSVLFTGDSPLSIEQYLRVALPTDIDVDIVKLGHHGSRTSSSTAFLKATSPSLALISAGVGNTYGHPHSEVTGALKTLGIPYLSTQDKGTVTLTTDGTKWTVK